MYFLYCGISDTMSTIGGFPKQHSDRPPGGRGTPSHFSEGNDENLADESWLCLVCVQGIFYIGEFKKLCLK